MIYSCLDNHPITVLIADDHEIVRLGLHKLGEYPDIKIVGEAENEDQIKTMVSELCPEILLLDIKMPGSSAYQTEKWIRENFPKTVTLVLTAHDRDYYLANLQEAGASGYFTKDTRTESLAQAIRRAVEGELLYTEEQINRIRNWRRNTGDKWNKLTHQEKSILSRLAKGSSNKNIAQDLGVSIKTIEFHLSNIFSKLGVRSRYEAASWLQSNIPEEG